MILTKEDGIFIKFCELNCTFFITLQIFIRHIYLLKIFDRYIHKNMRFKYIIIPIFLLFSIEFAEAQSSLTFDKLFSVGIHITKPEYNGDLGNSMWDVNSGQKESYWYYWGGGASFSVNLNASFFVSI